MTDLPDDLCERLSQFLAHNKEAKLGPAAGGAIELPWGDDSVILKPPDEADWEGLIECLNSVYLPPRFTAIYHRDNRDLEFIYGVVPENDDLRGRRFTLSFLGEEYVCEWADASSRLRVIADSSLPVGPPGATGYRNLHSVSSRGRREPRDGLLSFWLREVEWDENHLVELAQHINFYMGCFDRETPLIAIHQDPLPARPEKPTRYPLGPFPDTVSGQQIDSNLLGLWDTARSGDPLRRFLYYYQILEYASFYYMREDTLLKLRKIMLTPDLLSRLDETSAQMLDALVEHRMTDEQKLAKTVYRCVDPELVWNEIEPNLSFFSADVTFDGGFVLPGLLKRDATRADFCHHWNPIFVDALRKLRNALVHARESRMTGVIAPTYRNRVLVGYWLYPLSVTAMQVMLYYRA